VRVILISDSVHSGTVLRNAPSDPDADAPRVRFLPMGAWVPEDRLPRGASGRPLTTLPITATTSPWAGVITPGGDLLMAGCEEGPNKFSDSMPAFTSDSLRCLLQSYLDLALFQDKLKACLEAIQSPATHLIGSRDLGARADRGIQAIRRTAMVGGLNAETLSRLGCRRRGWRSTPHPFQPIRCRRSIPAHPSQLVRSFSQHHPPPPHDTQSRSLWHQQLRQRPP
jgi:hypothetical protein